MAWSDYGVDLVVVVTWYDVTTGAPVDFVSAPERSALFDESGAALVTSEELVAIECAGAGRAADADVELVAELPPVAVLEAP